MIGRGEGWRERGGMEGEGRDGGRGEGWRERGGMEGEGMEGERGGDGGRERRG